jgi:ParB family chromosome partitioning protein
MVKKRGLGKSLDALLSYTGHADFQGTAELVEEAHQKIYQLSIGSLQRGKYQPRREMDQEALEELANSIRTQGIIQPIIVRPNGPHYEIIAGERRFHAAKLAGLKEVPAIVREIPDDEAMAIALIENIQRENLNPIEEAFALERLIKEFAMTHQDIAKVIGKSRASVSNSLRLLQLPHVVKNLLERKQLEMGHARALITLPEALQIEAAQMIASGNLSVREAEHLVRKLQSQPQKSTKSFIDPHMVNLEECLSKQLKLRVAIQYNAKGKGKLVIHYRNLKELNTLLSQFELDAPLDN